MQHLSEHSMVLIMQRLEVDTIWNCTHRFLCQHSSYLDGESLRHIKDDPATLIKVFRLYQMYQITSNLIGLGLMARGQFRLKNLGMPISLLGKEPEHRNIRGGNDDSDYEDYSEDDFSYLMSSQQKQDSMKVYYDRLKELINPIDIDRLGLDSVHAVK